uniref:C2H2-type domain-containing protein n=1 Tax=Xiphophorus couchianus TaxID=32473 RepID=A0A3B5LBS3_9TELE
MADIANLARHLLMTEVLQICESVHKQVEEQKLTVYQKGDVHTVVAGALATDDAKVEPDAYMVTIEDDGSTVVTHGACIQQPVTVLTHAVAGDGVEAGQSETVALIAHGGEGEHGDTLTLISGCGEGLEGETMTVVTHSGQAGASESLAVVSACLAMEQPQVVDAGAFVLDVDADRHAPSEEVVLESEAAAPTEAQKEETLPVPQKRKRGRPPKVKREVEVEGWIPPEEDPAEEEHGDKQEATPDDLSGRRLRQRYMAEGGYARLHMGLEEEEEVKSVTPPPATPPKVQLLRGRPPKRPNAGSEEHTCSECGMSFQRRYSLIMHTLKHEKARAYKCSVSVDENRSISVDQRFLTFYFPLLHLAWFFKIKYILIYI